MFPQRFPLMFNDVAYECSFVFGNGFLQLVKHQMIDFLQLTPCTLPPSNNTINAINTINTINTCTLPPSNTHYQTLDAPHALLNTTSHSHQYHSHSLVQHPKLAKITATDQPCSVNSLVKPASVNLHRLQT